jgi:hypothetical protein
MKPTLLPAVTRICVLTCLASLAATPAWTQSQPTAADPANKPAPAATKNAPAETSEPRVPAKQEVTAPKSEPPPADDTVLLSPFEVTANNNGYQATNTMSGTRLNSKLEDIAASISVVTKQQLEDMAAIDINDIFTSEASTEGIHQYTSYDFVQTGGVNHLVDNVSQTPNTANRVRGLGTANFAVGGVSRSSAFPLDTYNIESVEISRGPNSSLFGVGNIAGTINLNQSNANVSRDISKFTAMVDNYGSHRETIDLNRVLFKNKLAIRVLGAYGDLRFRRKPAYDEQKRYTLALTAKPFKKTTIRGSFESYESEFSRPNSSTPREHITTWREKYGAPTYNPTTRMVRFQGALYGPFDQNTGNALAGATLEPGKTTLQAYGLSNIGTGRSRPHMAIINGQVATYIKQDVGTAWLMQHFGPALGSFAPTAQNPQGGYNAGDPWWKALPTTLDQTPATTNQAFYDWESDNFMALNYSRRDARSFRIDLEQMIYESSRQQFGFQGSVYKEKVKNYQRSFIGNGDGANTVVLVDVNEVLPDGSANPGFLRPYMGGLVPQVFSRPEENQTHRLNVAYQLNMTGETGWKKWIGRHAVAGYKESRLSISVPGGIRLRDQVIENKPYYPGGLTSTGSTEAASFPRYYLGDASGYNMDNITGRPNLSGRIPYRRFDTTTSTWVTDDVLYGEAIFARVSGPVRFDLRTEGFVYQGSLLDDRIVPVYGKRKDSRREAGGTDIPRLGPPYAVNPATGIGQFQDPEYALETTENFGNKITGRTETRGIVVKPLRWVHFGYNESNSFNPATDAVDTMGRLLPQPTGNGEDASIRLSFLDDKLSVRLNKFKTFTKDSRAGQAGAVPGRAIRLDFDLLNANDPTVAGDPDLEDFYTRSVTNNPANAGWTPEQIQTEVIRLSQFPPELRQTYLRYGIAGVSDTSSEGYELELNYNTKNWSFKVTGNKIETVIENMAPAVDEYIALRMPIWQAAVDYQGNRFWTTPRDGVGTQSQTPEEYFNGSVRAPLESIKAFIGQPSPQQRRYNAAITTNYKLAGLFSNKYLSATSVGGVFRWVDKGAVGFKTKVAPDGAVRYDYTTAPYYDRDRFTGDLWVGYDFTLFSGRVKSRLQLNVRNAFEDGGLRPVAVNSDGTPWNYRIIDPRSFTLTASFEL